jgi:membrane-bound lytic murein transglycosylase B
MNFSRSIGLMGAVVLVCAAPAYSAVIGANTPALDVSAARINQLPAAQRAAWADYIARSQKQQKFDRDTLAAELKAGETAPAAPVAGSGKMPLNKEAAWYGSLEARAIADTIVSFCLAGGHR